MTRPAVTPGGFFYNRRRSGLSYADRKVAFLTGDYMPSGDLSQEEVKQALKDGLNEWLDKQFSTLGKWTLGGIASVALAALAYFFLQTKGFSK